MIRIIKKYLRNQNSLNTEIILKATEISNTINSWLSTNYYEKVSMGQNCNSSWYLKETGNKNTSYPYDWIFSSGEIITHTIKDEFKTFLDKDMIFDIKKNKAGHSLYHSYLFNHRNPLKSDEDYNYYDRGVKRFLNLLKDTNNNILFVCTVIQEKEKRRDWANGFDRDFKLPINQDLNSFTETIELIQSINKNVKFIFINQLTEGKINLEVKTINADCLWIDFCSEGSNSGVKYRNKFDDLIMKIIYKGMYQKNT
ncbi:hypothetical protein HCG49_15570 [Arenibacter sp. 6A1]|uniref:DUF1796 family putative cysteine peptidase n=1 Tax=Arenibacter sp. 6A1 TaxID=2720391 RepID=UPI0014482DD6|nr:DUF1796 family putative cysteine peptidase [Arenibacter sp. 6A1]NKI27980.1 hypothetical protein [Arenibacter sp. 6A1]